jgi:hypothetical protein
MNYCTQFEEQVEEGFAWQTGGPGLRCQAISLVLLWGSADIRGAGRGKMEILIGIWRSQMIEQIEMTIHLQAK